MRIEMVIGANARQRYLVDGEDVSEEDFLQALRRRNQEPYSDAEWELNGQSIDPEVLAQTHGVE
jgi:hypothetical protein